jgi:hypothetical protein
MIMWVRGLSMVLSGDIASLFPFLAHCGLQAFFIFFYFSAFCLIISVETFSIFRTEVAWVFHALAMLVSSTGPSAAR